MASQAAVAKELSSMCLAYPGQVLKSELAAMVGVWGEAFEDVSDREFSSGCKEVLRRSKYYPSPALVREAITEMRGQVCNNHLALTEYMPPEKRWQNKIKALMCIAQVCRKCSPDQAAYVVNPDIPWPKREAVAREVLGKDFQELEDFLNQPAEPVARAREFGQAESGPAVFDLPSRPAAT